VIARYRKAWAAFAAGAAVFLASGLITGSTAVWISTAVAAVTVAVATAASKPNEPKG
jgi:uncharacterized membrane protein YoaK (UPF0700 family)